MACDLTPIQYAALVLREDDLGGTLPDELLAYEQAAEAAFAALEAVEYIGGYCGYCGWPKGHKPDCKVKTALAKARGAK